MITHNGGIFGFTADMLRIPADDVCVILLCNKSTTLTPITRNLLNIIYGIPFEAPPEKKSIILPEDVLNQYVGEYIVSDDIKIEVTLEDGKLKGQLTGQPKVELFAQRRDLFFVKIVDAQMEFVRGASGKVEKLIMYNGGAMVEAIKIK